ncbi:MAG: hypothetical protein JWM89_1828 [Acidimicrobiales bacterium]|nr:hypothetical protein [Acidimicrobiales bacterium]
MDDHEFQTEVDADGWIWASCGCGLWAAGPFIAADDASDAYGDHRAEVA